MPSATGSRSSTRCCTSTSSSTPPLTTRCTRYAAAIGHFVGIAFQLKDGAAGLPAFEAQVKRLADPNAQNVQIELGDDNAASAAFAQQSTSFEALALLVFAVIVELVLLVVVGQSLVRQVRLVTADFPALRALGASPRQLTMAALAPAALVASNLEAAVAIAGTNPVVRDGGGEVRPIHSSYVAPGHRSYVADLDQAIA